MPPKSGSEVSCFDLIIDDGLHTFEAGVSLFQHSIGYLHKNGVYVIEDVSTLELASYQDYFYNEEFIVQYVCLHKLKLLLGDNNLVVIRKSSIIISEILLNHINIITYSRLCN